MDIKKPNHFRDAIRQISEETHNKILSLAIIDSKLNYQHFTNEFNDLAQSLVSHEEGTSKKRYVTQYERDHRNRALAIAIQGDSCAVCNFSFGNFYGDYAKGYIQVHHVVPISELDGPVKPDPETDLIPLCANCHAVIHRKRTMTLTIDELKAMIAIKRN